MAMFFKKKNDRPLNFSYIQERKQSPNYFLWAVGILVLIAVFTLIYFLVK